MRNFNQKLRKNIAGFTVVEIAIFVVIVMILLGMSLALYRKVVTRSEETEAVVNLEAISKAEETVLIEEGTYVNATDTEEIEEQLDVALDEKIFTYRVEEATDDSYVAIAERIEPVADAPLIIALGPSGAPMYYSSIGDLSSDIGAAGFQGTDGFGSSGGSGGSVGTSGPAGLGPLGGGEGFGYGGEISSEPSGSGSRGINRTSSGPSNIVAPGPGSGGIDDTHQQTFSSGMAAALALLQNDSETGADFYDLIQRKQISVVYEDFSQYGYGSNIRAFWQWSTNKIAINQVLETTEPLASVASSICHEALHASYFYEPETWIDDTLTRHPELARDDLNIIRDSNGDEIVYSLYDPEVDDYVDRVFLSNSIDQEYVARIYQVEIWERNKGTDTNNYLDYMENLFDQPNAEALVKNMIRSISSYSDLPEY